ncbi:MAG TPA: hypothetical protein VL522_12165 [Bordetella sp.]|nr:hypothetical protein [Bordetella sp.]
MANNITITSSNGSNIYSYITSSEQQGVTLDLTLAGAAGDVNNQPFTATLKDQNGLPAGAVDLGNGGVTDSGGKISATIIASETDSLNLTLINTNTNATGVLPVAAVCFTEIILTVPKPPYYLGDQDQSAGVQLQANIVQTDGTVQPTNLQLTWAAVPGDAESDKFMGTTPVTNTTSGNVNSFMFTTQGYRKTDVENSKDGGINVQLTVGGQNVGVTLDLLVPFLWLEMPTLQYLNGTTTTIDDSIYRLFKKDGIPFKIYVPTDLVPESDNYAVLVARPRDSFGNPGNDYFALGTVELDPKLGGTHTVIRADVTEPFFQLLRVKFDLMYQVFKGDTVQNWSIPNLMTLVLSGVDATQPSPNLAAPTAQPAAYLLADYQANTEVVVTAHLNGGQQMSVKDYIQIVLKLTGNVFSNQGQVVYRSLFKYEIKADDLVNQKVVFKRTFGTLKGFLPFELANIDGSDGELYMYYWPANANSALTTVPAPAQSPSTPFYVDTVPPHEKTGKGGKAGSAGA